MKKDIISGGYLIYKPSGLTSRKVDNIIGKLLNTKRIGHIGTLDPIAEGLLPVLIGNATRIAQYVDSGIKSYHAQVTLGAMTGTDDSTGEVIETHPPCKNPERILHELRSFIGEIEQVPPKFSAKKVDGVRMYKRARNGEDIVIQPKKVRILSIENIGIESPRVEFDIVCGTGTYLRAIARDLGHRLGCGGYLSALVRTGVGAHRVSSATALDDIVAAIKNGEPQKFMLSEMQMLPHIPKMELSKTEAWRVLRGQIIRGIEQKFVRGQIFALADENANLLALAERTAAGYKYRCVMPART